jgi:hypothetical protein
MRYAIIGILIIFIVVSVIAPTNAHSGPFLAGTVSVEVISDSGTVFQSLLYQDFKSGETRVIKKYLEARKGENYSIVIKNNTAVRIGVVIAADGRNIITGGMSDLKNSETMYIVNPFETARYDGWRTTENEVHRFYFTDPMDSYSVRTFDDSSAMGVIAVAVFREKEQPQSHLEHNRNEAVPAVPSMEGASQGQGKALADESAGTGFGESQYSPVVRVEFEPELIPYQRILIKYEWRGTLCRKGILLCGQNRKNRLWDTEGYVPYPPDYPRN